MAQLAISVAGAAVGFAVGGPTGAQWGWVAGSVLGSVLFPPQLEGPHMADLRVQNSAYGLPIPIPYGTFRMAGNVIWAAPPVEHTHTSGGKGGPTSTTYSYSESFAVGLCEGPIAGVRRIWANGKLIYDVSTNASAAAVSASATAAAGIRIYLGSETQGADPTMQSYLGAGNVPGYRGLAYVVFTDFDLSPYGSYLPSLSFEVVTASSPIWTQQKVSSWSYATTLGTFFSATRLDAAATRVIAWGYYYGFEQVRLATLTPYASTPDGVLPIASPGSFPARGRSDVPGAFMLGNSGSNMAWLDGTSGVVTQLPIPNLPYAGNGTSFVKEGNVLWATAYYALTPYKLYRTELGSAGLTTSTQSGNWSVLGVSSSYVYVADYVTGDLLRFDKTTLALVDTRPTGLNGITIGRVVDDGLIYVSVDGSGVWRFDLSSNVATALFAYPASYTVHSFEVLNDSTILYTVLSGADTIALYVASAALPTNGVALSTIVSDICTRVGLSGSQIDVLQLTDTVQGYALTNRSAAKSNLQPLMAAYFFDACDTNAKLKFVKRGSNTGLAIAAADLGASDSRTAEESANPLIGVRIQEVDLPQLVELTYLGAQNDYENATQRAVRMVTSSLRKQALQLPVVLRDDEARQRCEVMLWSQWIARITYTFATPLGYLKFEPSDVVTVVDPDTAQGRIVRLMRCESNGRGQLLWTGFSEDPSLYSLSSPAVGGSAAGYVSPSISYAGPTKLVVIDAPPLRDTDTSQALYLGVCGYDTSWPGAQISLSRDGVTFAAVTTLTQAATVGFTQSALPAFAGGNVVDEASSVTVTLLNGTLAATDNTGLLAGVNAALIGQELVFFRDATLVGANTYRIAGFLRARQGTEWAMSGHTSGEVFALLNAGSLYRLPLQIADLGSTMQFMATTLGQVVSTGSAVSVTVSEACVRPLAPAGFTAISGSNTDPSDITLSWIRRARVNAGWLNGTDVPLDESSESYRLQVLNGSTVVRTTVVSGAQSWIYSAASISADGFSAGQTISFSVAQNSDQGVLGHTASTSIVR